MRTSKFALVVVLALALVVSACEGSNPSEPSDQVPPPPPSMPTQAIPPPGTNVVTATWQETKPTSPQVGREAEAIAWIYTPPGQGGIKEFSNRVVCNGVVVAEHEGKANTEVGYSSGRLWWWPQSVGSCTFTSTVSGSTRSLDFVVVAQ